MQSFSQTKDATEPTRDNVLMAQRNRDRIFLKDWRKHRGLTQEELGFKMAEDGGEPVSNAHISHIESGRKQYTQDMLERFAVALDCAPFDLLIGPPDRLTELRAITALIPTDERHRAAQVLSAFLQRNPVPKDDAA